MLLVYIQKWLAYPSSTHLRILVKCNVTFRGKREMVYYRGRKIGSISRFYKISNPIYYSSLIKPGTDFVGSR